MNFKNISLFTLIHEKNRAWMQPETPVVDTERVDSSLGVQIQ